MPPLHTRADEIRALRELRAQVRAQGLDRPTPFLALSILLLHLTLMLGGVAVFAAAEPSWARALGMLVSTYGSLGIGMTGHNASHCSVTGSRTVDRGLTYLSIAVLNGISALYWRHKHIGLHHSSPNNVRVDSDIDLMPCFALNSNEVARATGWRRRFYRVQHWVFPFLLVFTIFNLQAYGMAYLAGQVRRRRAGGQEWVDLSCLVLHFAFFLLIPACFLPFSQVIGFYVLRGVLNGYATFAAAAPAHFPPEAKFVAAGQEEVGMIARQVLTTVNFRTGIVGRAVCLGAEYQIEHHLLPGANPLKLGRVSEIVRAFCHRHGYPYQSQGWGAGIVRSFAAVRTPKPVLQTSDLFRMCGAAGQPRIGGP